jgi:glucokinase
MGAVLGVDLGGTAIKAELLDDQLGTIAARTAATPAGTAALDAVASLGRELLAGFEGEVLAAGVAVPGIVDPAAGRGLHSVNLGWRDVPVRDVLTARLDLPVAVEHDVTAAGRAEWLRGAGRGVDDLLVVVIGTGIAAVVVAGGQLVRGGRGQAGELGHVLVVPDGPVCVCGGRGCLEAVASARAIAIGYGTRTGRAVSGSREVFAALQAGDRDAHAVWDAAVDALATALLGAIGLLGCSRVVIGGGLAEAGAALFDPLRRRLGERRTVQVLPDVVPAALGLRAGVIGAGLAARDLVTAAVVSSKGDDPLEPPNRRGSRKGDDPLEPPNRRSLP